MLDQPRAGPPFAPFPVLGPGFEKNTCGSLEPSFKTTGLSQTPHFLDEGTEAQRGAGPLKGHTAGGGEWNIPHWAFHTPVLQVWRKGTKRNAS